MQIDWAHFTPLQALLGGSLIGLSAAMLLLINGRMLGISGIVGGLVSAGMRGHIQKEPNMAWRLLLIAGIFTAPFVYQFFHPLPALMLPAPSWLLPIAGFLVGIGTRYGAGCTSGHGVCGLGRFSRRSAIATLCFMASGVATTYVMRHLVN